MGARPMKFSAKSLSKGLKLVVQSGQISDMVSKTGTYKVMLKLKTNPVLQNANFVLMTGGTNAFFRTLKPTKLTPDEQYTQVSLWRLVTGPLLLS